MLAIRGDTGNETLAERHPIQRKTGPSSLILRPPEPAVPEPGQRTTNRFIAKGGYVLREPANSTCCCWLPARNRSGAEAAQLAEQGIGARVVSLPSTNVFDRQDAAYRASVLPKGVARVAIEAGVSDFWRKYVGLKAA